MNLLPACFVLVVGWIGCVSRGPEPIKTQVFTYPEGALVEFNGRPVGRAPAAIILPQDTNGRLIEKATLRAVPNTAQPTLYAQSRTLDPARRSERVPDRIMIDLTLRDTNSPLPSVSTQTSFVEGASSANKPIRVRQPDSGKPTRPAGIDRWNPGIY
jgi:hypothetical protein